MLEHLAGDDEVEALVAAGQPADVGHEPAAAGPPDRSRDQVLTDIDADHDGAPADGGFRERAVATARVQRPAAGEAAAPQALVEHDAQAAAHILGIVEALEAVGDALVEVVVTAHGLLRLRPVAGDPPPFGGSCGRGRSGDA